MHLSNCDTTKCNARKTLVVGDLEQVLIGENRISDGRVRHCPSLVDAVSMASQECFFRIFLVLAGQGKNLESGLAALRRVSSHSEIILLPLMYEEPIAMRLVRSPRNPHADADRYVICPIECGIFSNGDTTAIDIDSSEQAGKDQDIAARMRELELLATQDDLTNLKNRRYVREFLKQIIEKASQEDMSVTLLVFDIDNFKHYNDTFGHAVGDNVLQQAALMMKRCCREHDVIARIGGDEFAVVFWDKPDQTENDQPEQERRQKSHSEHPDEVLFITERFRKEISSSNLSSLGIAGKGELTISGGLASYPRDGRTVEQLFELADRAMLNAKRSGKNQIYLVGPPKQTGTGNSYS